MNSKINAGKYFVYLGDDVFKELKSFFKTNIYSKLFILADENSVHYCLPVLVHQIQKLQEAEIVEIESGEENKSIDVCTNLWEALGELKADRKSLLINLGGGVIGDMGGFVASTFKRGIDFVNIPTTLLAQVDASVGGKVAIDLSGLKNEVGLFSDPKAVFVYPEFLKTLSKRQLLSGFAEVIKHALIADKNYWIDVQKLNLADDLQWNEIIGRSIVIKNKIVSEDPLEKNIRKVLNFGHTIGHAIESYSLEGDGVSLLHGEAIAIGMICETYLSYKTAGLPEDELQDITQYILSVFKSLKLDKFDDHRLIELMRHDKKNESGNINFTLLRNIGTPSIDKECSISLIKESLKFYREQVSIKFGVN